MDLTQVRQTLDELRGWDWRAELERQERTQTWLARQTNVSVFSVYKYGSGERVAPIEWLMAAARALGKAVPS